MISFWEFTGKRKARGTIPVLAFLACVWPGDAHAQSSPRPAQTASATLHIAVVVVPVVGTMVATRAPAAQESGAIIYKLQSPVMSENYEIRMLPSEAQKGKKPAPAILKTLVVVPR